MASPNPSAATDPLNAPLDLGRGIKLALCGQDLVITDKARAKKQRTKVCGIPVGAQAHELVIPLYNILWAAIEDERVVIDYAKPVSKSRLRAAGLQYPIVSPSGDGSADTIEASKGDVRSWIDNLHRCAYGPAQCRRRAKVLVNPHAGPGGADKIWENDVRPLFEAARMHLDVARTTHSGQAIDICEKIDPTEHDIIIPCSGDGLAYEVFNGIGRRPDARAVLRSLAVAHIPCGSGNGLSWNLNGTGYPSFAALAVIKGVPTPMDLMSVTQGETRTLSFLSQSVGIIAESDLDTEHMRWMGAMRFNVGVATRIFGKKCYPCDVAIKVVVPDKDGVRRHYRTERANHDYKVRKEVEASDDQGLPPLKFGTIHDKVPEDWETISYDKMGNFYAGNMAFMAPNCNFFPGAMPNDGLLDIVSNDGDLSVSNYLELMTSLEREQMFDNPNMAYRKALAYRLTPRDQPNGGCISVDGERVPFEPFQVEVHPGLATVISRLGRYDANGPTGWEVAEQA